MRALLVHVRPHRRTLVLAALLGLLGAAAGLAQPLAAREVIEALAADDSLTEPLVILSVLVAAAALVTPCTTGCSSGPRSGSCCAPAAG